MSSKPTEGQMLGHFRLLERLGAGGMGVVYRAHDESLNRDVAVKVLPPGSLADETTRRRFKQEAQALARLNHPNIATIFEFDCDGPTDFLAMELLSGQTLAYKLLAGPLPVEMAIKMGVQIADGLAAAHEEGILHRDLKPSNLGLTTDGRVKILDFGLAKLLKVDPTDVTQSLAGEAFAEGTLAYMAPEQLRGEKLDSRVDIYSAGSVLYEMVTGKRPHPQERGPLLINAIFNEPPLPPSTLNRRVSLGLEATILKALQKEPDQRYQSARELASDLELLRMGSAAVAIATPSKPRSRPFLWPVIAVAGILALALLAWQVSRRVRHPIATEARPMLLVGEFENRTGEPVFDNTLREMFTSSLEQSHLLQVFPASRLVDVLQRMGRPPTQRIDEDTGREICQREGIQGLLTGSIVRLGKKYVLIARAESPSGSNILNAQTSAQSADEIPARVDEVAETIRRKLGESLQALKEHSVPLDQVTSRSLDAVRYFTLGKQSLYNGDPSQAKSMFEKALELDPKFAIAHEYLGLTYQYLNQYDHSVEEIRQAAQMGERVSEPERLRIMAAYYSTLLDVQKECENYQLLAELQPLNPAPYVNLGVCKVESYDYAAAVPFTEQALHLVPQSDVRINLASHLLGKGDSQKALEVGQSLSRDFPNNLWAQTVEGRIYMALGRFDDAQRTFKNMMSSGPDAEIAAELSLADLSLACGQYQEGEKQLRAAIESADRNHNRVTAAKSRIALAEILLQTGQASEAQRRLAKVELPPHAPALAFLAARANAWAGNLQAARRTVREIESLISEHDVPALQALRNLTTAEIAFAQHNFREAVEAAQNALTYQKSVVAVETLARCYAAAGMPKQSAQQYETLMSRANELMDDTRVEGFDEPAFRRAIDAHYRLAIQYQKLGRIENARTELQKFLSYWSHADADLVTYKEAQRFLRNLSTNGVPTPAT